MVLGAIYLFFLIQSSVYINLIINLHFISTTAAAFFFPITFIISDIIAEVFGYKIARLLIWIGLCCQFIFAVISVLLSHVPESAFSHTQASYRDIFHNLLPIFLGALIAALIADFINIYLITKLKILVQGRFFALRSIGCSIVGNLFYTSICCAVIYHNQPISHIIELGTSILLIKIIYLGILAFPASFMAHFIKEKEGVNIFDKNVNYNPFKVFDIR